ncbi:phosphoglycolate phosphatase [Oceanospirillum multiglobuliferum]|uniref:HAD family hydrolase n=1 Tax=Oceanospirillum multiglobuliferum TaxID=64969 RepID=A0A1T4R4D1_9GAMM|nr:HAD-IA family hydrolase [Oceanospirillum multiglobuliferum]OPX55265.1 HAD family hydrolase [Oceanospirillum multiglobuliferum]SKA10511.1 phosphoglycolate phosphatase [Oceanospirillum multiglobuliferum]
MKYSLVIFDWDGTLIDSEARIIASMQAAGRDVQWPDPLSDEAVRNIIGLGLPEAIRELCPGISGDLVEQVRQRYSHHFLEVSELGMPLFEGVLEGLQRLKDAGCTLAVATGKSRRGLDRGFRDTGLGRMFRTSRCADETKSKPDPLMLNELLKETGFSVHEAVMVGDTEFDLGMAENAGMDRIAVTYGAHHPDRLKVYQPIYTAHKFMDLIDWILASAANANSTINGVKS